MAILFFDVGACAMIIRSHIIWFVLIALAAVLVWDASTRGHQSTTSYTCVQCRAIKHSDSFFRYEYDRIEKTEFSQWYAQSHSIHRHQWAWCGTVKVFYPLAQARGCGKRHPIWQISPDQQRKFVMSATPEQLQGFYTLLNSPDLAMQQQAVEMVFTSDSVDQR